jgi:hypothetical protein
LNTLEHVDSENINKGEQLSLEITSIVLLSLVTLNWVIWIFSMAHTTYYIEMQYCEIEKVPVTVYKW